MANFVAATSANSAIGAHALDSDEVKNSMHALDTDNNGTVKTWAPVLQAQFGSDSGWGVRMPDFALRCFLHFFFLLYCAWEHRLRLPICAWCGLP